MARTLERKWEEALLAQRALEEDFARFQQGRPHGLTAAERAEIETLARDLPMVWRSPQTGVAEKRRIIRSLLERVVVWAPGSSREVTVHLHWSLGTVTEHRLTRPVRSWDQLASTAEVRRLPGGVAGGGLVVAADGRGVECGGLSDTAGQTVHGRECPATAVARGGSEHRGDSPRPRPSPPERGGGDTTRKDAPNPRAEPPRQGGWAKRLRNQGQAGRRRQRRTTAWPFDLVGPVMDPLRSRMALATLERVRNGPAVAVSPRDIPVTKSESENSFRRPPEGQKHVPDKFALQNPVTKEAV